MLLLFGLSLGIPKKTADDSCEVVCIFVTMNQVVYRNISVLPKYFPFSDLKWSGYILGAPYSLNGVVNC